MRSFVLVFFCLAALLILAALPGGAAAAAASAADNAASTKALEGSWSWATTSGGETYSFNADGTFSYVLLAGVTSSSFTYRDMREYREKINPYATSLFKKGKYKVDGMGILFYEVYKGGSSASSGSGESATDKLVRQQVQFYPAESFEVLFEIWPNGTLRLKGEGETLLARHGENPHPGAPVPQHRIPAEPWPAELLAPLPEYKHGRLMNVENSPPNVKLRFAETDKAQLAAYLKQLQDKGWTCIESSFNNRARLANKTAYFSWENKGPLSINLNTAPMGVWPQGTPDDIFPPAGADLIGEIKVDTEKDGLIRKFSFEVDKTDAAAAERHVAAMAAKGWERVENSSSLETTKRFVWHGERWKAEQARTNQEGDFASFRVRYENLKRAVWPARELPPDLPQPENAWLDEDPQIDKADGNRKTIRIVFHGMDEAQAERYFQLLESQGWERPKDAPENLEAAKRLIWNGARHRVEVDWSKGYAGTSTLRVVLHNLKAVAWPAGKIPADIIPPHDAWLDEQVDTSNLSAKKSRFSFVCHNMGEAGEEAYYALLESQGWERLDKYGYISMEKRFVSGKSRYKAEIAKDSQYRKLTTFRVIYENLDAAVWPPPAKLPPEIIPPQNVWLDEQIDISDLSAKKGRFRFTCHGLGEAGEEAYYAFLESQGWERLDNYGNVSMEKRFVSGKSRYKAEIARDSQDMNLTSFRVSYENLDAAVWPSSNLPPEIIPPRGVWLDEEVDTGMLSAKRSSFRFTCHGLGETGEDDYYAFLESQGWKRLENYGSVSMERRFSSGKSRYKAEIAKDSQNGNLITFRVSYENLDAAVWPSAKLPPEIIPPKGCWLDEEVDGELHGAEGGTLRFDCHGMDEDDVDSYFSLLKSQGWRRPSEDDRQTLVRTVVWQGKKQNASISLSGLDSDQASFRASFEPEE